MNKRPICVMLTAFFVAGCSLAPEYKMPDVPVAATYKESGPWVAATPADQIDRAGWWKTYNEPELDSLEQQLIQSNPDLSAALSHYAAAQAFVRQTQSDLYPQVGAVGNAQRDRESDTRPLRGATSPADYNSATLGVEVDYEVDLWGRVRDSVAAGKDEADATKADLASVQLSLEAQLAESYIQLRGFDQELRLLSQTADEYQRALTLTEARHTGGVGNGLDVARAKSQYSSAQSQLSQVTAMRAVTEHTIAVLVGASASDFSLQPDYAPITVPQVPLSLPSALLQRRPDIAAAERRVAEANSKIGVARAAYFPSLTLSAQGGLQSSIYGDLLSAPSSFWAIGPSLATYIFDGGKRRAQVDSAKAATEEAGAKYRGVVLASFKEVEDNLSLLSNLGTALGQQQDAASEADVSVNLALERYKRGTVSYLDVVQAQTTALDAQRAVINVQTQQLGADVGLIRALGGGWSKDDLARS
ncbi:NodT family efflux transporter outer membrane factor (OMF) lipoprotein [Paraburkholderia sp. GAS199]|uniref:efflux transporter outer membrane subunit n=1 Tax=Paraburkholderia sp. GAS199 TaxID=3035126 RepID=UPI003D23C9B4